MTERDNPNSTVSEKTEEVSRRVALTVRRTAKDFTRCGKQVSIQLVSMGLAAGWEFHGVMEEKIDGGKGLRGK